MLFQHISHLCKLLSGNGLRLHTLSCVSSTGVASAHFSISAENPSLRAPLPLPFPFPSSCFVCALGRTLTLATGIHALSSSSDEAVALWHHSLFVGDISVEKTRKERKDLFSSFVAVRTGKAACSSTVFQKTRVYNSNA
jgi:hypothetical protein